ncbi:hypothetical protein Pfo_028484 [Paulownia fortunei]|nr:hypothetical protein Pfo_028484 [Paulownia fortunei]
MSRSEGKANAGMMRYGDFYVEGLWGGGGGGIVVTNTSKIIYWFLLVGSRYTTNLIILSTFSAARFGRGRSHELHLPVEQQSGHSPDIVPVVFRSGGSFNLAISSFTVSLITNPGVDAPLTLSFFTYLALAVVYGSITLYRRQKLLVPWYWYVLLGFVDVQGNYLVFGAGVCLGGLGLVLLSDYTPGVGGGSKPFLAILLSGGTVFLSMSNVGMDGETEFCVKKKDRVEVMTMIGVFGILVSASGTATLERKSLESINWSPQLVFAYVGCTIASFMFYTLGSFVLKMSGATLFNLSLLTSDMWAVVFRIFIYKQQVKWLYYPAYALVALGIFIYTKMEKDPDSTQDSEDANASPEYSLLDQENADIRNGTLVQ